MKTGWWRSKKFLLLVLAVGLIALLTFILPIQEWSVGVRDWLKSLGNWAIPAFVVVYVLASVVGFPNIVLILVAGTVFGLVKGIASASVADTLGALACFFLGRTIARQRIKKWIEQNPQFVQIDRAVGEKGWKILLLSRLSPLIPSNVLNYGFSCTQVNFWQYFFFTWLGMLPVIGFYAYLGSFGMSLMGENQQSGLAWQALGIGATVVAAVYTTRLAKSALAESETPDD